MEVIGKTDDNEDILIMESQSVAPAIWVAIISITVIITSINSSGVPMGLYGKLLILTACSLASFIYLKRSFVDQYILTSRAAGIYSHMLSAQPHIRAADIDNIHYVYYRQTGIRWLLAKLRIIQYGDLCFSESINSNPLIVFHNISNVKAKYDTAYELLNMKKSNVQTSQMNVEINLVHKPLKSQEDLINIYNKHVIPLFMKGNILWKSNLCEQCLFREFLLNLPVHGSCFASGKCSLCSKSREVISIAIAHIINEYGIRFRDWDYFNMPKVYHEGFKRLELPSP